MAARTAFVALQVCSFFKKDAHLYRVPPGREALFEMNHGTERPMVKTDAQTIPDTGVSYQSPGAPRICYGLIGPVTVMVIGAVKSCGSSTSNAVQYRIT